MNIYALAAKLIEDRVLFCDNYELHFACHALEVAAHQLESDPEKAARMHRIACDKLREHLANPVKLELGRVAWLSVESSAPDFSEFATPENERDLRILALCFAAAMDEAGDLE